MSASLRFLIAQADTNQILDDALTGRDWLTAAAILVGAMALAVVTGRLLRRLIGHAIGPGFATIVSSRLLAYSVFLVGLFYALATLGVQVGPLLGALGLGGLVLALALQRVVENFVASVILQARRPFTVGDTVELDGRLGIVADIDSRTTFLRSLDGTQVRIPNANVVSSTIINLTREPTRRSSLRVGVAYETDLQQATQTLREALERVPRIRSEPRPSVNLDGFGDSSIGFTILYWHASDVPSELAARHDLVIAIHQALTSAGITIAFPQMVVWSGQDLGQTPYSDQPAEVHTPHPSSDDESVSGRRLGLQRRRPGRRSSPPGTG